MTRDRIDVLIVGAGPSGSALGSLLAQHGVAVRIVDKASFPRVKACGECVNPGAVEILARNGLLARVLRCQPASLHGWQLSTAGGATALGVFPRNQRGLGLSRERLDDCLLQESVSRGAEVQAGSKVVGFERMTGGGFIVSIRRRDGSGSRTRAAVLVGADGLRSTISRRLHLIARRPRLRKLSLTCRLEGRGPDRRFGALYLGENVTVGLAPIHEHDPLWNGTVVVPSSRGAFDTTDTRRLFQSLFAQAPFTWAEPPAVRSGPWASGPFDWPTRCTVADDALLVGDAAGYFDPLTGQGICRSLRSAELAAETLVECLRHGSTGRAHLMAYHRSLRREMRGEEWLQRAIELVISRSSARRAAVGLLSWAPLLADRLVAITGNVPRYVTPTREGWARALVWKPRP